MSGILKCRHCAGTGREIDLSSVAIGDKLHNPRTGEAVEIVDIYEAGHGSGYPDTWTHAKSPDGSIRAVRLSDFSRWLP